jgi:hypothetical protein
MNVGSLLSGLLLAPLWYGFWFFVIVAPPLALVQELAQRYPVLNGWWGGLLWLFSVGLMGAAAEQLPLLRTIAIAVVQYLIAFELMRRR